MKSDLDLSCFGYRLPPTERFGFVNYFSILGQYKPDLKKLETILKIDLDVNFKLLGKQRLNTIPILYI